MAFEFPDEESAAKRNNPDNLSPEEILKEAARLSEECLQDTRPQYGVLEAAVADGGFVNLGKLNIDKDGCVVLTRVAQDEQHLSKDWVDVEVEEMINTSLHYGGGRALPTSGLEDWTQTFGRAEWRTIGTFRIPVKDFLEMIRRGEAVLGNISEGEIVLNPRAAQKYLAEVRGEGNRPPDIEIKL